MNRLEANRIILDKLRQTVEKNPNLRFIQILWGLGIIDTNPNGVIIDRFHEEPYDTLTNLNSNLKHIESF